MPSPKKIQTPPPSGGKIRQHALQLLARIQGIDGKKKEKKNDDETQTRSRTSAPHQHGSHVLADDEEAILLPVSYDEDSENDYESDGLVVVEDYRQQARKVLDRVGPYGMPQPIADDDITSATNATKMRRVSKINDGGDDNNNVHLHQQQPQSVVPQSRQRRCHHNHHIDADENCDATLSFDDEDDSKERRRHSPIVTTIQNQASDISVRLVIIVLVSMIIVAIILYWDMKS